MLERILNAVLEGEMDAHLSNEEGSKVNCCNGKMPKQVQTRYGEVNIEIPRDCDGSFTPQIVKKREAILAEGMADQIIRQITPIYKKQCIKLPKHIHCEIIYSAHL